MARILIVDDSLTARNFVSRILGEEHELTCAAGGAEALQFMEASPPDLVILDLLMPGMSGFDVLEWMKARSLATPVLVLSADIQKTTRDKVLALGAAGMVNKPPRPDALRSVVRAMLEGAAR